MPGKKKSVTLKDVAQYAGVSPRTVSNVVNDWPYVSEEMRHKVKKAIKAVGYRPNQMARSLVTGQTKTIGVIIQDISNPFFGFAMRGCGDILYNDGYSLLLCNTNKNLEQEKHQLDMLVSRAVDAIILWGAQITPDDLIDIVGDDMPLLTVEFAGESIGSKHTILNVDNTGGAELATRHLIEQGYHRIAHIAGPSGRATDLCRFAGYRRALTAAGVEFVPQLVVSSQPSIRCGYRTARALITSQHPDAIFCYNDLIAVGAILAAHNLDQRVPQDVAIVGFDDIVMASMIDPPLTTVRIAQYDLGTMTGEFILERLRNPDLGPKTESFPVDLQVRASSGAKTFSGTQKQELVENLISYLAVDFPDVINNCSPPFIESSFSEKLP